MTSVVGLALGKLRDIQIKRLSFSCEILTIGFGSFLFIYCFLFIAQLVRISFLCSQAVHCFT